MQRQAATIIGFGPGLGQALAEAFGAEGMPLALIARNQAKVDTAALRFRGAGFEAQGFAADAGDEASLVHALSRVEAAYGGISVLIYNAAHWRSGPVLATTASSLIDDFRIFVAGALVAAQVVVPSMVKRGAGTILFTGGGFALYPSPDAPSLSIGKGGIRALALMLAKELAPKGIRVGTVTVAGMIAPGTPFAPELIAKSFLELHHSPPDASTAEIIYRGINLAA